jgi:hypothetical protein
MRVEWRQGPHPLEPHGQDRVQTAAVFNIPLCPYVVPRYSAHPDAHHAVPERVVFLIVERLFSCSAKSFQLYVSPGARLPAPWHDDTLLLYTLHCPHHNVPPVHPADAGPACVNSATPRAFSPPATFSRMTASGAKLGYSSTAAQRLAYRMLSFLLIKLSVSVDTPCFVLDYNSRHG